MNNILAFNITNPKDISLQIASRVKTRRLELNLTQEGMAARAKSRKVQPQISMNIMKSLKHIII